MPSGFNAILLFLSLKANFNKIGEIIVVTTTTITIGPNITLESTPSAAPLLASIIAISHLDTIPVAICIHYLFEKWQFLAPIPAPIILVNIATTVSAVANITIAILILGNTTLSPILAKNTCDSKE